VLRALLPLLATLACGGAPPRAVTIPAAPPGPTRAADVPAAPTRAPAARYPHEVRGFELWASGPWHELVPLRSTLADVRRVLGEPESADDIAHYGAPYPGDAAAEQPVLVYRVKPGWRAYVYLVRSDLSVASSYSAAAQGRLLSVEFVPDDPVSFAARIPKHVFRPRSVHAADASWTSWEDGTGLRYDVYARDATRGRARAGDLSRIGYGPSDDEAGRARR
jgi:hypothetical protein